jgi:predicted transcriptional regulator
MLMVKLARINIGKQGLQKFFSPNEVRIMELLWEREGLTSSEIKKSLKDLSLPCVAGTLDRLVRAELIKREIDDSINKIRYTYYPARSKDEVGTLISERVYDSLVDTFGSVAVDSFGKVRKEKFKEDSKDV